MKKSRILLPTVVAGTFAVLSLSSSCVAADEIFVSNNGGNSVDEISTTGVVTPFATQDLNGPTGIVFNSSGDMFVANNGFGYIEEFTSTGSPIGVFASGLNNPRGMTIDNQGNIYVANQSTGIIDKITPQGAVSTYVSGLSSPNSISFNSAGDLLVAEGSNSTVASVVPGGGSFTTFSTTGTNNPDGLTIGANGTVYVVNSSSSPNIEQFNSAGTTSSVLATAGLCSPQSVDYDSSTGMIYVTDAA